MSAFHQIFPRLCYRFAALKLTPLLHASTQAKPGNSFLVNNVRPKQISTSANMRDDLTDSAIVETAQTETLYRAIDILIKGHEAAVLESFMTFMNTAAQYLDIHVAGQLSPKFIADRSTFLKSIHIHKKHRVQYEIRTHRRVLQLKYLTSSTANAYLEYVERNIPAGVAMHVHKWKLEQIPEHIQERMKENMKLMSEEDWKQESKFTEHMQHERLTKNSDYEEYHTTKRFLLGTVM